MAKKKFQVIAFSIQMQNIIRINSAPVRLRYNKFNTFIESTPNVKIPAKTMCKNTCERRQKFRDSKFKKLELIFREKQN